MQIDPDVIVASRKVCQGYHGSPNFDSSVFNRTAATVTCPQYWGNSINDWCYDCKQIIEIRVVLREGNETT